MRRKGVSEVLGALLLIIVVVVAVSSLAYFVASTQAAAEKRSSYLASVANENLQVPYAQFSPNSPSIQWELDNIPGCTSPCGPRYYVQIVSVNELILTQIDNSGVLPITITKLVDGVNPASTLFIHKGATAQLNLLIPQIDFGYATPQWVFNPATWSNLTVNVLNLNTQDSDLFQIKVNNNWLSSWEQVDQTGHTLLSSFSPTVPPLVVPAKGSVNLNLSLAGFSIAKNDSVKITLLTTAGNFFTTLYSPPIPVIESSASTENYQIITRDIITFDGSHSTASGDSIQTFLWEFQLPTLAAGCSLSAFSNPANLDAGFATGETVQYNPEGIFTTAQLQKDCITGPIKASLVAVDDNGLMVSTQPVVISSDPNIAPVASLTGAGAGPSPRTITITVMDIFGRPASGVVVTAATLSGDASTSSAQTTGAGGVANFVVSWTTGGSIQFTVGALPSLRMSFP
jgi:flagellin-like protein